MASNKSELLLFHQVDILTLQTRLTNIMCDILFILGIVGNVAGLFIFSLSRRTWQISSIYTCLATCSAITNLLCVIRYAALLHSTSRDILSQFVGKNWWACKFYEFTFCFRITASWITLFWMFERLLRVSKRLRIFCHRWISYKFQLIIPILMIIIILICVNGPSVYMYEPNIILNNNTVHSTVKISQRFCGINPDASIQWQKYFYEVHFGMNYLTIRCIFSELIPTGAIIFFNTYIIYHLLQIYHHLHQLTDDESLKKQSRTTSWMNAVLTLHSFLLLLSIFCHIIGHLVSINVHETYWVLLPVLINCSLNFYIYCLSGKAFRNEIRRFIHRFKIQILS